MRNTELLNYETISCAPNAQWIVFIHGAGGSTKTWKYQVPDLSKRFNLLLLDLRDHGESNYPEYSPTRYNFELLSSDIKKVMIHLSIPRAHFVTLSMGSILVQDLMMRYPKLVAKTVFAGGIFSADASVKLLAHMAALVNYFLPYRLMYRLCSFLLMPNERNQKARKIYQHQAKKLSEEAYQRWIGLRYSVFDLLESSLKFPFKQEGLVIMGADDYIFHNKAKKYVMHQPNTQMVSLQRTGHICNIEKPQLFNIIVMEFLKDQSTEDPTPTSRVLSYTN